MKLTHHIIVLSMTFGLAMGHAEEEKKKPNIILILTDDQGYGDVGKHGHPYLKTPHMDQLHDESVRFNNFYVSPSCSPTRAALLTGIHEFKVGVTHTLPPRQCLHKDAAIIPQLLEPAGYRSAFIGKWHLGEGPDYSAANRGFDYWAFNEGGPHKHFDVTMKRNGKNVETKGYRENAFFDEAMNFIDETVAEDKPFFCYLCTYSPHTPLAAPEKDIEPFRADMTERQATYLAMVANIDQNLGRLNAFLKERELDKDTILIFMNDNGQTEGLDVFNANMRGCKATIWEGGSRAISFWRWPETWKPHTSEQLTAHLDVVPTLCEVAGVDIPADLKPKLDGYSLTPLLEANEDVTWEHEKRMLFHHVGRWPSGSAKSHKHTMGAIRQGKHLLLRSVPCNDPLCEKHQSQCTTLRNVRKGLRKTTYTTDNAQYHWGVSAPDRWSLYQVKDDPECEKDIALDRPEQVAALGKAYDQWWDEMFPILLEKGGDAGDPEVNLRAGTRDAKRQKKIAKERKKMRTQPKDAPQKKDTKIPAAVE